MKDKILVVGAGPVGLAGALFLVNKGFDVQVVERLLEPEKHSKALAVNPRTLEILESTEVTKKMLELGMKIDGATFWREDQSLAAEIDFDNIHTRFPFMLALSQAVTERLLSEALSDRGVQVERGVAVISCENRDSDVVTKLANGEVLRSKYVFAADGAHSVIRRKSGIRFQGRSYIGQWNLVDVALETQLRPDRAHIIFRDGGGFYFLARVIEDASRLIIGDPIWRVISSFPDPLRDLKVGKPTSVPVWKSSFNVAHRINERLQDGGIFFAGDAAHTHSPAGARGMNLGIEDAWVFAFLLNEGRVQQYGKVRKSVDKGVVHRVDLMSRIAMGEQAYVRALRDLILPEAVKFQFVQRTLFRALSGLDHSVELSGDELTTELKESSYGALES